MLKKSVSLLLVLVLLMFTGCNTSESISSTITSDNTSGFGSIAETAHSNAAGSNHQDVSEQQPLEERADENNAPTVASVQEPTSETTIQKEDGTNDEAAMAPEQEISDNNTAESILAAMSLREKVAQLFIICPESLVDVSVVTAAGDMTRAAFNEIPVGGFIYMGQNLESREQTIEMLSSIQQISMDRIGVPVFTAVDEEGGTVARVAGNPALQVTDVGDMADIGATYDRELAYEAGDTVGEYLQELGFNLDFAPDADVLTNPDNEIVKYRSFGTEPDVVSEMSLSFAAGLSSHGILACAKHFPGHGATLGDTHEGYAYTDKSLEELEESELIPFQNWIQQDAGMIMVGHISLPTVLGDNTPASLSHFLITELLRDTYGFNGLIITDALNMGAITQQYGASEAALLAFEAGADLLLMPEDFFSAYNAMVDAVENGRISVDRIDQSVLRILQAKLK